MKQIILPLAFGLALAGGQISPAFAQTGAPPLTPVVERLRGEGYTVIDTHRSWLGRLVILSTRDGILREIVINRTTGAILSDRLFDRPVATAPAGSGAPNESGNGAGTGGGASGDTGTGAGSSGSNGGAQNRKGGRG
jgi:uncharacterized membrane protein YgcG